MTEEQKAEECVEHLKSKWQKMGERLEDWNEPCFKVAKLSFIDGYHEGFKDCAKSRLNVTTISDCPIKDEWHYVKNGDLPKDEWHYVKNGDLPKENGFYEVAFHNIGCDATDISQWLNNEWWHSDGEVKHYINEKIYAWRKKSQPPKELAE